MSAPNSLFDLSGRTALITGSSQGLGFALARGLAQAGARLILNGRDETKLAKAASTLREEGWNVFTAAFDVTDSIAIQRQIDRVETELGPIDILVNNAGIQRRAPLEQVALAVWREVIETNLTSAFLVAQKVAPQMIARRAGKIINICSLMSEVGRATTGPYTAAKGGLKMLTRAMAVEWAKHNLQINGVGPGYFATELTKPLVENPEFNRWVCQRTPANRWGQPHELVGATVFLASSASNFVNGQIIYVDGGMLASL